MTRLTEGHLHLAVFVFEFENGRLDNVAVFEF